MNTIRRGSEFGRYAMDDRIELLVILAEAEADVKAGRVAPIEDTFINLRRMLETVVKD